MPATSEAHEVARDGEAPLVFDGRRLSTASTETPEKERWTEIRVWRTDGGYYVWQVGGRTRVEGERDRWQAGYVDDADALVRALEYKGRLSRPAWEALDSAAAGDPRVDDALTAYEGEEVQVP